MKWTLVVLLANSLWGSVLVHGGGSAVFDGEDGGIQIQLSATDLFLTFQTQPVNMGSMLTCTSLCYFGGPARPGSITNGVVSTPGFQTGDFFLNFTGDDTHLTGTLTFSQQTIVLETYVTAGIITTQNRVTSRAFEFLDAPAGGTTGAISTPLISNPEPSGLTIPGLILLYCYQRRRWNRLREGCPTGR